MVNCSWVECDWDSLGISVLGYDSLDSILDEDAFSGLNLFVVDSTVFSGDEIVDDGIVDDSFVSTIELPGCCVVSELVLYELVSSGSFWGCVKSELS